MGAYRRCGAGLSGDMGTYMKPEAQSTLPTKKGITLYARGNVEEGAVAYRGKGLNGKHSEANACTIQGLTPLMLDLEPCLLGQERRSVE